MARFKWLVVVLAVLVFILPACGGGEKTTPVTEEVEPVEEEPPPPPPPPVEKTEEEEVEEEEPIVLKDVFFEFDKSNIKDKYKEVLRDNAEILLENPDVELLIEGHCDERGTNEYNLALGERRAKSVIEFYMAYGIPKSRLSMVSYGEERPFAKGHNEEAWAKNRRAHMVVQK